MNVRHHILPAALTLLLAFTLHAVMKPQPGAVSLNAADIYVIDGDTIRLGAESIRLSGYNTPEIRSAACDGERVAGTRAKDHLRELINSAGDLRLILKLKRDGTPAEDKFRRHIGQLLLNNQDIAAIMIEAELAEPYTGGTRRTWCD